MDKLAHYRQIVQSYLTEYADWAKDDAVDVQTNFDTQHDHYQLTFAGWDQGSRVYGIAMHMDIQDGKVWIQYNGTEENVAEELIKRGIPRDHIILAWLTPFERQYSGYAVA